MQKRCQQGGDSVDLASPDFTFNPKGQPIPQSPKHGRSNQPALLALREATGEPGSRFRLKLLRFSAELCHIPGSGRVWREGRSRRPDIAHVSSAAAGAAKPTLLE